VSTWARVLLGDGGMASAGYSVSLQAFSETDQLSGFFFPGSRDRSSSWVGVKATLHADTARCEVKTLWEQAGSIPIASIPPKGIQGEGFQSEIPDESCPIRDDWLVSRQFSFSLFSIRLHCD